MLDDSSPIQEPHLRDIKDDAFSNGSTAVPSDTGTPVSEPLEKSFRYSDYTKDSDATYTSEQERKILSRQLKGEAVKVKLKTLYRYATPRERLILLVSTICALAAGTAQPLMTVGPKYLFAQDITWLMRITAHPRLSLWVLRRLLSGRDSPIRFRISA